MSPYISIVVFVCYHDRYFDSVLATSVGAVDNWYQRVERNNWRYHDDDVCMYACMYVCGE